MQAKLLGTHIVFTNHIEDNKERQRAADTRLGIKLCYKCRGKTKAI
jgi:hypothetical protein